MNPPSCKMNKFFLMSLALSVPIVYNKWKAVQFFRNCFCSICIRHSFFSWLFLYFQESSISILREDEEDDAEVGDILNDEEINNILEDDDDDE